VTATLAAPGAVNSLKALADGNRLRIVLALRDEGELCACQIVALLGVAGPTASRHLARLVDAGLLRSRKDGRWVHYRLDPAFARSGLLAWLERAAAGDPAREHDRAALAALVPEDITELCRRHHGPGCCPLPRTRG